MAGRLSLALLKSGVFRGDGFHHTARTLYEAKAKGAARRSFPKLRLRHPPKRIVPGYDFLRFLPTEKASPSFSPTAK